MKIEQFILSKGWQKKGGCNCSGGSTTVYELKTNGEILKLRVKYSNFTIGKQGEKLKRYPIEKLQNTIDEICTKHNQVN